MTEPAFWAVIPAAGVGARMAAGVPKQYLELGDRTVLDHAIERLLLHPQIDGLTVAVAARDGRWQQSAFAGHPDIAWVTGGPARCHSVLNALTSLRARADGRDWVLVHDAARPLVRRDDIGRLIDRCRRHPVGGLLGTPVSDTMKRADADGQVVETVPREGLWHAYTPQMFRLDALTEVLGAAIRRGGPITDEASAMEQAGYRPLLVEGDAGNLKITRPDDLQLATYYLANNR